MAKKSKEKFSLNRMRDVVTNCVDLLYKGISKQNPLVDIDALENDLRALITKHGSGSSDLITEPSEVTASVLRRPNYNLAADIFCLAYDSFREGDIKGSIELLASAMESDGIDSLVTALEDSNAETDVHDAVTDGGESDPEDEEEPGDDGESYDDSEEEEDDQADPDNFEDNEVIASDYEDEELDPEEEEPDNDEDDSSESETDEDEEDADETALSEAIASVSRRVTASMTAEQRALINKVSLTGTKKARQTARRLK